MKEMLGRFFAILLISLLLVKISAFHVYEHHDELDDSNTHCELCVLTIAGQQFDAIIASPIVIVNNPLIIPSKSGVTSFGSDFIDSFYHHTFFSRPPPHILG